MEIKDEDVTIIDYDEPADDSFTYKGGQKNDEEQKNDNALLEDYQFVDEYDL